MSFVPFDFGGADGGGIAHNGKHTKESPRRLQEKNESIFLPLEQLSQNTRDIKPPAFGIPKKTG